MNTMTLIISILVVGLWPLFFPTFLDKSIPAKYSISQLTPNGIAFLVCVVVAIVLNCVLLVIDDRATSKKEAESAKRESESLKRELENATALKENQTALHDIKKAIEKSGYILDSAQGIIKPKNIQNIAAGKRLIEKDEEIKNLKEALKELIPMATLTTGKKAEQMLIIDRAKSLLSEQQPKTE